MQSPWVVGIFPNEASCLRLITAILVENNEEWYNGKNYLKKQQLIKFGSTAPNQLLRDMYENSKLCCEIINENPQVIVHNFKEE